MCIQRERRFRDSTGPNAFLALATTLAYALVGSAVFGHATASMSVVIKAPNQFMHASSPAIFLAGSIEMGAAPDWRGTVAKAFAPYDVTLLDPWRDDWDDSWEQSIQDERFREQVEWELAALEASDFILMYFAPGTQAPITLLEFGLFARSGKLVACCPVSFWRRGNIEVVCDRYAVPCVEHLEETVALLLEQL